MLTRQEMAVAGEALEQLINLAVKSGVTMPGPTEPAVYHDLEKDPDADTETQRAFNMAKDTPDLLAGPTAVANLRRAISEGRTAAIDAILAEVTLAVSSSLQ